MANRTPNSKSADDSRSKPRSITQPEQVLIAIYKVAKGSDARVPYEEIVLQAWRDFPETFSLRNHPEHPDASDVHKKIYQSLKPNGFVVALGDKVFRLTEEGISQAEALSRALTGVQSPSAKNQKARLSRSQQSFIDHALKSRAFLTWRAGDGESLIEYDARLFFQFSTATAISERRLRVQAAKAAIDRAQEIGISDASSLQDLADFLTHRFASLIREG